MSQTNVLNGNYGLSTHRHFSKSDLNRVGLHVGKVE